MIINELKTEAKILLDSISPRGVRLTTFEVTFWRAVLAEFNTHRVFGRNSRSSRAVPVNKVLAEVQQCPFIPLYWGAAQSGMVAEAELPEDKIALCKEIWLEARDDAMRHAKRLLDLGLHKQTANRLLEPFMHHTVIVTATEYSNFFALRAHPEAQPEIRLAAELMLACYQESTPTLRQVGEWHLPLVEGIDRDRLIAEGFSLDQQIQISAGRSARVSYMTHHGVRDPHADIELCMEKLAARGHMSPLEHPAQVADDTDFHGHLRGWIPYRKFQPNEHDFGLILRSRN